MQALLNAAVRTATEQTRRDFQARIDDLTNRLGRIETTTRVEEFQAVTIQPGITCDESLDLVKTMPEFNGDQTRYVSWRQAAHTAYKVFEGYAGSSKHYQAVGIIRNKIVGSADMVLSSFNTVLNFHAIISSLDFTYADKNPVYLIEQELSMLTQGALSVVKFYDEIERKLTLIINKTTMTHGENKALIESLSKKYREDALRVFISGLNRPLCDILFSSRPADLPSALALAQELEANQARMTKIRSIGSTNTCFQGPSTYQYSPQYRRVPNEQSRQRPVPMDVDPSLSRFRQTRPQPPQYSGNRPLGQNAYQRQTDLSNNRSSDNAFRRSTTQVNAQPTSTSDDREKAQKRQHGSDRHPAQKIQRVNHLANGNDSQEADDYVDTNYDEYDNYNYDEQCEGNKNVLAESNDDINFLGLGPSCPISAGHSGEEA